METDGTSDGARRALRVEVEGDGAAGFLGGLVFGVFDGGVDAGFPGAAAEDFVRWTGCPAWGAGGGITW